MKISELAAAAGCDAQTIRFYEREKLLAAPSRTDSGYRDYGAGDVARLQFIRRCRALDIPLDEVRELLAYTADSRAACADTDALIEGHLERVRERIAGLRQLERDLVRLRRSCAGGGEEPCGIIERMASPAEGTA